MGIASLRFAAAESKSCPAVPPHLWQLRLQAPPDDLSGKLSGVERHQSAPFDSNRCEVWRRHVNSLALCRVFTDKLSGAVNTVRPGLAAMIDYARAGDTVVVTAIDRLGRSVAEVTRTIAHLGERRILLRA
jgi:DNA invertase Pin-like site-specific DNA recombinase